LCGPLETDSGVVKRGVGTKSEGGRLVGEVAGFGGVGSLEEWRLKRQPPGS
jgi:hypothetical protein